MHRADRGLERVDLHDARRAARRPRRQPRERRPRRPPGTTSRRASARSTASTRTRCSAPATASPTTRFRGRVRCAASTRRRSAAPSPEPAQLSAVRIADRRASRTSPDPDLNSGRFPLPNTVDMRTPEVGNVDRGTHPVVERRLRAPAAVGPRGGRRLRRQPPATAATRTSTSTRRRSSAAATPAVRTSSSHGPRTADVDLVGAAPEDAVPRAAGGREPAVHQGPAAEGRLHAGRSRRTRPTTTAGRV